MYQSQRRNIRKRAAFASVAVTAFVIGGGAFTSAFASDATTAPTAGAMAPAAGAMGGMPGMSTATAGTKTATDGADGTSVAGTPMSGSDSATVPAAGTKAQPGASPMPVFEIKPDAQAASTETPVAPKTSSEGSSSRSRGSATRNEIPKSTPTASESQAQPTSPVTVASPSLARTGVNSAALAALGSLFTAIGLAFLWLAMRPQQFVHEFAYSSPSNFYGRIDY